MKKFITNILIILTTIIGIFFITNSSLSSARATVLKGYIETIPTTFFGTWRVKSKLINTDNTIIFKSKSVDIWNLYQEGNVIILSNPFSGATGEVQINSVKNKTIKFTKKGNYDNKILTDTVEITIDGNNFSGTNNLILEKFSDVDSKVIKTEKAQYYIVGERIGGQNI